MSNLVKFTLRLRQPVVVTFSLSHQSQVTNVLIGMIQGVKLRAKAETGQKGKTIRVGRGWGERGGGIRGGGFGREGRLSNVFSSKPQTNLSYILHWHPANRWVWEERSTYLYPIMQQRYGSASVQKRHGTILWAGRTCQLMLSFAQTKFHCSTPKGKLHSHVRYVLLSACLFYVVCLFQRLLQLKKTSNFS